MFNIDQDFKREDLFDISPLINGKTAVFPGDTPYSEQKILSWKQGHHLELSTIQTTLHMGAHADAPLHYHPQGNTIARQELHYYLGDCQVIEVELAPRELIRAEHLSSEILAPRILFKTLSFTRSDCWHDQFNALHPSLISYLAKRGVITVGIDTPSVDLADSKDLACHQEIYQSKMAILEGLDLQKVPPALYTLIALPLKLESAEASPVRALLIKKGN